MRLTCLNGPIVKREKERERERRWLATLSEVSNIGTAVSAFSARIFCWIMFCYRWRKRPTRHTIYGQADEKHSSLVSHAPPPPPNVDVSCCWSEENFRVITIRGRYVGWKWRGFPSCVFILLLLLFSGHVSVHPIPSHRRFLLNHFTVRLSLLIESSSSPICPLFSCDSTIL